MKTLTLRLQPLSPFGTPPVGDTLFGQLCWTIRNQLGEPKLAALLRGYTAGQPFAVVSDAFPTGYVRRPDLPPAWLNPLPHGTGMDRKAFKKRVWLPLSAVLQKTSDQWHRYLQAVPSPTDKRGESESGPDPWCRERWQPHNQIDRRTGTTGKGEEGFAPFVTQQWWYDPDVVLDVHVCHDPARIEAEMLLDLFGSVGKTGYGADASTGMGRFAVEVVESVIAGAQVQANAWLTLAPCAPQGLDFDAQRSWYRVSTRFGRHGDIGALSSHPFKAPILLADSGAVFSPRQAFVSRAIVGRGLGQQPDHPISHFMPETVHQGYAPVLGIQMVDGGNRQS